MGCWNIFLIFWVLVSGVRADEWDDFAGNLAADLV